MYELLTFLIMFVVSLSILVKSSDYFTDAAYSLGKHFRMSDFVIGVVIVSIGTSLPELATTVLSSLKGENGIILGNLLGSNISNILLILGITSFFVRSKIKKELKDVDLPISVMLIILLVVLSIDRQIGRIDALLLMLGFLAYMLYAKQSKRSIEDKEEVVMSKIKALSVLLISIIFVYFSSKYVIESLIGLATQLGIATTILSASALAIGTSLPELMVSIQAVRRNLIDVVVGNIIGSNIFNIGFILSIGALINPILYDGLSFYILLPFVFVSTFIILEVLETNTIRVYEGILMLLIFVAYLLLLVNPYFI